MNDYEKLKAVIQKANPEIMATRECECPSREDVTGRPIGLDDVLQAIKSKRGLTYRKWVGAVDYLVVRSQWGLLESLDDQSQEVKQFLINLLTSEKVS